MNFNLKKIGWFFFIFLTSGIFCYAFDNDKDLEEELKYMRAEAIDIVSIATKLKAQSSKEAPSIVSVIDQLEIKQLGAKTLEEILKTIVGFNTNLIAYELNPLIIIRGLGTDNDNIRLLINGHPIGNCFLSGMGYWEAFPVNLIQKIEIIRGPGSALYGNNSMNGTINIITKDSTDPSMISSRYGTFNTYGLNGQLSSKLGECDLYFFADHFQSKGDKNLVELDNATYLFGPIAKAFSLDPGIVSSAPSYTTENFKYQNLYSKINLNDFYVMGMYNHNWTEMPLSLVRTMTDNNSRKLINSFLEFGYDGTIWNDVNFVSKVYYDFFKYDYFSEGLSQKTTQFLTHYLNLGYPAGEGAYANPSQKNYKIGSEITLSYNFMMGLNILGGYQYEYHTLFDVNYFSNVNQTGRQITLNGLSYQFLEYLDGYRDLSESYPWIKKDDRSISAFYTQMIIDFFDIFNLDGFGKDFTLTAGVRHDSFSDVGESISPRAALVYVLNDHLYFKTLYGKAFRAPSFRELYNQNNAVINGNPNLKPETASTQEGLIGFTINNHISGSITGFYTEILKMIERTDDTSNLGNVYDNTGKMKAYGIEGELKISFDKNRYGLFNITSQRTLETSPKTITDIGGTPFTQTDNSPGNIPELLANLVMNTDITQHINWNISLNYKGKIKRSDKLQFTPEMTDPDGTLEKIDQRAPIQSRTLVNTSLIFNNFKFARGLDIQLTGYNIFNTDDRSPEFDGVVPNDIPRWGRHFLCEFIYSF
ncbi:MAG: TonB-dependent receptor [Desulfobacterales bacterium]|nr:TonB-dependent receptor [Desulfobacterales bacterium]